jgi:hypothetical protein
MTKGASLMPEKTIKRRLEGTRDRELADDDGPIFSTVAKLVEALKRSIPEGTENAERKKEALHLGSELLRGTTPTSIAHNADIKCPPLKSGRREWDGWYEAA